MAHFKKSFNHIKEKVMHYRKRYNILNLLTKVVIKLNNKL